jgi:hypothetical protein
MAKPNEQTQIDFILDCLRNGEQRKDVLSKFGKKWQGISSRTFDRRLKDAETQLQGEQQRVKQESEQEAIKEIECRKSSIMTAIERQELLSQIAKGEIKLKKQIIVGGEPFDVEHDPDISDRINAIKELNKIDGNYTPIKTETSLEVKDTGNLAVNFVLTPKQKSD